MEEKNRKLIILMVILGTIASLIAGGFLVVTREIGLTHDKALYFTNEYTSEYEVFENNDDEAEELFFSSIKESDDEYIAKIKYKGKTYETDVDSDGFVIDGNKDCYFFLWWEEEDLKIVENYNGNGFAISAEEEEKNIKDPQGVFLNMSKTYVAVCQYSLVYLKGRFATQASLKYIIQREDDGRVVGDAIVDMTSGLPFEINYYEEGEDTVHIKLLKTDFPISRNRVRLLTAASICLPITFVVLYFILRKKRDVEPGSEEMRECMLLGSIGVFAVWLDQFIDFWFTYTAIMPLVIILHFVPIILILVFKKELWHYIFIPIIELGIYGCFVFFNMGIFVLWLSYGSFALFFALLGHYAYADKRE